MNWECNMIRNKIRLLALMGFGSAFLALASGAEASSDDAWKTFAADVLAKCKKAAAGSIENAKVTVDPFGSEHYGMAVLTGKPKGAKGLISHICVYDKKTKAAEIGSELDAKTLGISAGK